MADREIVELELPIGRIPPGRCIRLVLIPVQINSSQNLLRNDPAVVAMMSTIIALMLHAFMYVIRILRPFFPE